MKRKKSPLLPPKHLVKDGSGTPKSDSSSSGGNILTSTPNLTAHPSTFVPSPSSLVVSPHVIKRSSAENLSVLEDLPDGNERESSGSLPSLGSDEALHISGNNDVDGATSQTPDLPRTKAAIDHIHHKILNAKDLIKAEQTTRDENVNEYLKLATNADKQQLQRIKSVFEKKNQKSAQMIAQLQKKLENYNKRIRQLETHGLPRGVLRDMGHGLKGVGANIKGGITGLSGGMVGNLKGGLSGLSAATHTAAEEFAHLIKNKFGSADNINTMCKTEESNEEQENNVPTSALSNHSTRYTSDEESSSVASESGQLPPIQNPLILPVPTMSPEHHSLMPHTSYAEMGVTSHPTTMDLEPILQELRSQREEYQHLVEELDSVKSQIQQECIFYNQSLQEERYRCERLEEQMNDLIELHQNEIENLKQGFSDMEEKVQYQSEERLRDVHDVLDSCQTRISRMEHQQHQHLQQLVSLDNFENSQARALLLKLINIVLTVLQVVLLLMATFSNIMMPFLRTRVRTLTTAFLALLIILLVHEWPEFFQYCHDRLYFYLMMLKK